MELGHAENKGQELPVTATISGFCRGASFGGIRNDVVFIINAKLLQHRADAAPAKVRVKGVGAIGDRKS